VQCRAVRPVQPQRLAFELAVGGPAGDFGRPGLARFEGKADRRAVAELERERHQRAPRGFGLARSGRMPRQHAHRGRKLPAVGFGHKACALFQETARGGQGKPHHLPPRGGRLDTGLNPVGLCRSGSVWGPCRREEAPKNKRGPKGPSVRADARPAVATYFAPAAQAAIGKAAPNRTRSNLPQHGKRRRGRSGVLRRCSTRQPGRQSAVPRPALRSAGLPICCGAAVQPTSQRQSSRLRVVNSQHGRRELCAPAHGFEACPLLREQALPMQTRSDSPIATAPGRRRPCEAASRSSFDGSQCIMAQHVRAQL